MTAAFAFRVGVAAAESLRRSGILKPHFVIGRDTRRSGPMLAHAVAAGLTSRGAEVTLLEVMPTPAVSYLTRCLEADAGIVISASHNPFEDNGIKFFNAQGEKLSDALEHNMETLLAEGTGDKLEPITGRDIGSSRRYRKTENDYYKFLLSHAPYLDGLRVGLDCANGAAYDIAPRIFKQLGARIDVMGVNPDGSNINVDCGSTRPEALQERVAKTGLEVGVTFDGDADRALLVDAKGRLVTGDHMLAICAVSRQEKAVVATLMSNLGLEHYLADHGIELHRCNVGDRYVHEKLRAEGLTLGGEQSGHLLFLDKAPTGDGLLSALQTLAAVRKTRKPLDAWLDEIPMYPQTLLNVRVTPEAKGNIANRDSVQAALKEAEAELGDQGRINLRPSGTEPLIRVMVEGPDLTTVEAVAKRVAAAVKEASVPAEA